MITPVLLVLSTSILYLIYWCIEHRRRFQCLDHIPGPKPLPFLGNILEFGQNCEEKLYNINRLMIEYGPINKVWLGPNKFYLLLADPDIIEFFISSPKYVTKSADYDFLKPWLKNGLLISTGGYWQKRRKIITPTFHFKILEEFAPVFNSEGKKLVKRLENQVDKGIFDIYPYIQAYTLDVICETAMGTSVHAQENPDNEYVRAVKTVADLFMERIFSAWKQFDTLYQLSSSYRKQTEALNIIHGYSRSIIEARRDQLLRKTDNQTPETNNVGEKKRAAFLDVLLQATINGQPLSNNDISEEVDTFMFEGHDTTASGLGFALYEISRHQNVQNKIVEELHDIFGEDLNREPTIQDLNDMKYLELVIKETVRLYPPVPLYGRRLDDDVYYKGDRYPKGMFILFVISSLQRRESLFKDAENFIPERFLDESMIKRNPFIYLPFSAGPRNCIGQKFAMYEMKAALCKLLRHFEFLPPDGKNDLVLSAKLILKAENGISVKIKNRKW